MTLAESQNKKSTFLREVVRTLALQNVEVWAGRAEDLARGAAFSHRGPSGRGQYGGGFGRCFFSGRSPDDPLGRCRRRISRGIPVRRDDQGSAIELVHFVPRHSEISLCCTSWSQLRQVFHRLARQCRNPCGITISSPKNCCYWMEIMSASCLVTSLSSPGPRLVSTRPSWTMPMWMERYRAFLVNPVNPYPTSVEDLMNTEPLEQEIKDKKEVRLGPNHVTLPLA